MSTNYYMEKLYQDMQLRAYSEHTQDVYGRAVRNFLNFGRKSAESLNEQDVRNYTLHLMNSDLSKGSINTYQAAIQFFFWSNVCYQKKWVVYCKPPFDNEEKVIAYLGRYTHRVAISNDRILSLGNGKVTFRWRDYAHGNQMKLMTLDAEKFIRRFLLHILPGGFRKIRHYGLFSSRNKGNRLVLCRRLTNTPQPTQQLPLMALLEKMLGKDFNLCPCCKMGHFSREPPCSSKR